MKKSEVAKNVRVVLNSSFKIKSLADECILQEPIVFIVSEEVYNDREGDYVFIKGGSFLNNATAYLTELDLEFPINDSPLYFTVDHSWREGAVEFLLAEKDKLEKRIFELDEMALIKHNIKNEDN